MFTRLLFTAQVKPERKLLKRQLCYTNSFTVKLPVNINIIPPKELNLTTKNVI